MAKLEQVSEKEAAALFPPKDLRRQLAEEYRPLLAAAPDGALLKLELEEGEKSSEVLRALRRAAGLEGRIVTLKRRPRGVPNRIVYFQVFKRPLLEVEE